MRNETWEKIGTTEHIDNNLNPDFKTCIPLDYQFEKLQRLKFEFVDVDLNDNFDLIGEIETSMGSIMGSKNQVFMGRLVRNGSEKHNGIILVRAESVMESNDVAIFSKCWSDVPGLTPTCFCFGKSNTKYRFTVEKQVKGANF